MYLIGAVKNSAWALGVAGFRRDDASRYGIEKHPRQPLPEMGRDYIWRTGTAVDDIGGDHYLEVLIPPIWRRQFREFPHVLGVRYKLA